MCMWYKHLCKNIQLAHVLSFLHANQTVQWKNTEKDLIQSYVKHMTTQLDITPPSVMVDRIGIISRFEKVKHFKEVFQMLFNYVICLWIIKKKISPAISQLTERIDVKF